MKRSKVIVMVTALMFLMTVSSCAAGFQYERRYSFPEEEPVDYICCAQSPPREMALLFNTKGTTYGSIIGLDASAESIMGLDNSEIMLSSESKCVRLDSLSPLERLSLERPLQGMGESCNTFGFYEHFQCSCNTSCTDAVWNCNCPGVPSGSLPEAAPADFPQDSVRSRPEFVGEICTPCNSFSSCE